MNRGKCYSRTGINTLLIIGGVILGVIVLILFGCVGYCMYSSLKEDKKNEETRRNHVLKLEYPSQPTSLSFPSSLTNNSSLQTESMKYLKRTDELLQRIQPV